MKNTFGKIYLIFGILFLFLVGGGYYGITYLFEKIEKERDAVYEAMAESEWEESRLQSLDLMQKKVDVLNEQQGAFDVFLLEKDEQVKHIAFLESIAEISKVDITVEIQEEKNISNKKDEEEKDIFLSEDQEPFDLRVTLRGSYEGIYNFLSQVENAPTFIFVRALTLEEKKEEEGSRVNMERSSSVFSAPADQNTPGEETGNEEDMAIEEVQFEAVVDLRTYVKKEINEEQ